jgi:hypothetical protein
MVLWVVTSVFEEHIAFTFTSALKMEAIISLQNFGYGLQDTMVSESRKPQSTFSPP